MLMKSSIISLDVIRLFNTIPVEELPKIMKNIELKEMLNVPLDWEETIALCKNQYIQELSSVLKSSLNPREFSMALTLNGN